MYDAVEMRGIVKGFGSVLANDHVDFSARRGEIHALLGENGAGKSTLMSILSGVYRADGGTIFIHGKPVRIRSPKDAMELGIGMVYQNFRLVPTLTAVENMILGEREKVWRSDAWLKRKKAEIGEMAAAYGLPFPTDRPVWQLSVGEQQRVEIVKMLYRGAEIIILDEPTSVLTPGEAENLFETLRRLKEKGKTIILITHKLKEVMAVSDRISVMRKGRMIAVMEKTDTDVKELARLMVGKEIGAVVLPREILPGETILVVDRVVANADHGRRALDGISFTVRRNEIVGIAGVAGNGQKELAEVLTGLRPWQGGKIIYGGETLDSPSARRLIDKGVAHVPENRMKNGLAGSLGVVDNLLLKTYRKPERSRFGLMLRRKNEKWARELVQRFDVRTADLRTPVRQLSGGNQQKLLFAREVDLNPSLMIAVHPTQGLDVGAADEVHRMLVRLRDAGSGVLLISEDLDEVMQLSDRILVIYNGKILGEFERSKADRERIGLLMAGMTG